MKEIKAFLHRHRLADVVRALKRAGYRDLTVIDVKGILKALNSREQEYSLEIGDKVITEVKLELICEEDRVDEAVRLIRENGRTGQRHAGWVYVGEIIDAYGIDSA